MRTRSYRILKKVLNEQDHVALVSLTSTCIYYILSIRFNMLSQLRKVLYVYLSSFKHTLIHSQAACQSTLSISSAGFGPPCHQFFPCVIKGKQAVTHEESQVATKVSNQTGKAIHKVLGLLGVFIAGIVELQWDKRSRIGSEICLFPYLKCNSSFWYIGVFQHTLNKRLSCVQSSLTAGKAACPLHYVVLTHFKQLSREVEIELSLLKICAQC